jgi:hypothetical protein
MEDNLNIFENGRRRQFFLKEDDLNFFEKMTSKNNATKNNQNKNDNSFDHGRQPHFFNKGRRPQKKQCNQNN